MMGATRSIKFILLTSLLIFLCSNDRGISQSLTGATGLMSIPTGEILEDGEFSFGVNVLNKKHLEYFDGQQHTNVYFVTIGFLPFLEAGLRYTRAWEPGPSSVGDRMISMRVQMLKERDATPSLVLGAHDVLSTVGRHFNALYLVGSKNMSQVFGVREMVLHLGYGVDWIAARNHDFVGLFGGVSWAPHSTVTVMIEYDADRLNAGLRFFILHHLGLLVGVNGLDALSGGISYTFKL